MRWQRAEQINRACQIRVGSGSVCQSPKKSSFLWSSSQVSGYLSEMAAVGFSSLPVLGTAERFVEALQEVCEWSPGCWGVSGWHTSAESTVFCLEKLENLCLWVARERRYFSVWGQLALPSEIIADYYLNVKRPRWITSTSPFFKRFRLLLCGAVPLQVEKRSVCFRSGVSVVISHHRKDYTCNTQEKYQ